MRSTYQIITSLSLIATLSVIFLFNSGFSSDSKSEDKGYVIVRAIECKGGDSGNQSVLYIYRGAGQVEEVELETFNKKGFKSKKSLLTRSTR
jgi:hypothetical protein